MQARAAGGLQEGVVRGVELHLVDAPAEAVVRQEARALRVGQPRMRLHPGAAAQGPQGLKALPVKARVVMRQGILQGPVGREEVHVGEGRALVGDGVGGGHVSV